MSVLEYKIAPNNVKPSVGRVRGYPTRIFSLMIGFYGTSDKTQGDVKQDIEFFTKA